MSDGLQAQWDAHLRDITARLDLAAVESQYWEQDEFVYLGGVFSPALVSELVADLHKRTKAKPVARVEHSTTPVSMLLFCGDNVWHATSPLERGEERIVMCLSYVVRGKHIRGFKRFTKNVRDAAFYFGLQAFKQRNDAE